MGRFRFNTRVRHTNESVAAYVAALRGIAQNCEFSNIDEQLRDQVVVGINNEPVQRSLLPEPKLTFKSVFDIAQSVEVLVKNTLDIRGAAASGPVSLTVNRFTSLILTQFLEWKTSLQLLGVRKIHKAWS